MQKRKCRRRLALMLAVGLSGVGIQGAAAAETVPEEQAEIQEAAAETVPEEQAEILEAAAETVPEEQAEIPEAAAETGPEEQAELPEAAAETGPGEQAELPEAAAETETQRQETACPELVIWLDQASEYVVRNALANYSWLYKSYGEYGEAYPELAWKLVDKSYLTPEQFRQELLQELEAGGGPDLIYMDEYNGISPQYMMESGYLMDLGDITENPVGKWEYLPGVMEAGQTEGIQYVLPVYVQCPVLYGRKEEADLAGLDTEEGYGTLADLLTALLRASEESGKQIFENESTVDWIEACCLPQKGSEEEKRKELEALLGRVRERCGGETHFFSPYESLESGQSLLSGCAMESIQKLAQNLGRMEKGEEAAFFSIPAWDGEIRAVITQSVAANSNTRYPKEARALVRIFQESYVNYAAFSEKYFFALAMKAYWRDLLASAFMSINEQGRVISPAEKMSRQCRKYTGEAITAAMFLHTPEDQAGGTQETERPQQKDVLTVAFNDHGMNEEYPLYRWLADTAEQYSNENLVVQLIAVPGIHGDTETMRQMIEADAGVDVMLSHSAFVKPEFPGFGYTDSYMDLTSLLKDADGLRTVTMDEKIVGISYGIRMLEDGSTSWDYVFVVPESSAMPEEAVGFCLAALENENCQAALTEAGILPLSDM